MQQGNAQGNNINNWYLVSSTNASNAGGGNVYRPEVGSYSSNLAAASTLFTMQLADRQGGGFYTDPVTGEKKQTTMWLRTEGVRSSSRMSDGQSKTSANRMVFQLGGDLLNGTFNGYDIWHVGSMVGYGKQDSKTSNRITGYRSKGDVSGYSAGLYGTWYQNAQTKAGWYIDSWVLYNWFNNTVKGDHLDTNNYHSRGFTTSIESGYALNVGHYKADNGMEHNFYIRPQAQMIWSGVKAENHTESNGTFVKSIGRNNIQTRLGMRMSMISNNQPQKHSGFRLEPFVETNWIHQTKAYGVKMDGSRSYIQGSRNNLEVKAGVDTHISERITVWGSISQRMGSHNYYDTKGTLGMKVLF